MPLPIWPASRSHPAPRPPSWLIALSLAAAFGGCPSGATGPELPKLEITASDNPEAEADLRAARNAEERGDTDEARERYAAFLEVWPDDPATAVARLSLGRLALLDGDLDTAMRWFDRVAKSAGGAMADKGRFFGAVARQRAGRNEEALATLRPMLGRTVDPQETALLLHTIAEAEEAQGDFLAALGTRDRMLAGSLDARERQRAEAAVAKLVDRLEPELALPRAYESLPRSGFAWPLVARRWLIEAYRRSDTKTVLQVGHDMDARGLALDEDLRELIVRAQRRDAADTRVLGAILPLSGRGQEVGQSAMRGLMLAAGLPSDRPPSQDAFRIVFRDGADSPEQSALAVEDLASLHRAIGIIGPVASPSALSAARRANDLGVPLIALSPAAGLTDVGERVFRLLPGPEEETRALVDHAAAYGAPKVAVMHPDNGYGLVMRQATQSAVARAGGTWAGAVSYAAGATSFGKEIEALAALAPDAVLIADSAMQLALIAPALAAGGLWSTLPGVGVPDGRRVLLLLPSTAFSAELANTTRRYLQGAVFCVPFDAQRGAAADFADRYRKEFGEEPNVFAAYAYDAYRLFVAAVTAGSTTRTDVASQLLRVQLSDPVGPTTGFAASRGPREGVKLQMLVGGAFSPIATASGTPPTAQR